MIVYKSQGIDWHPQSDSLGVSPLKWTQSTLTLISGSCCLVESLRQLICFIGCFNVIISPSQIHFGEQLSPFELVNKLGNEG